MTVVPVFRCDPLRLKLTIAACADNHRVANGTAGPATASMRGPRAARAARLGPCQGCKTGAVHAETGKARNGLRLEVLQPLVVPPTVPASQPPAAFDDIRPGAVPAAATVAAPGAFDGAVSPRPAAKPRPADADEEPTMRKTRPNVEPPKNENLELLRGVVEKHRAALGHPKRVEWPAAIVALACRCVTEEGIPHRVVGAVTGIHEVTIYAWVRKAKRNAAVALDAAVTASEDATDERDIAPNVDEPRSAEEDEEVEIEPIPEVEATEPARASAGPAAPVVEGKPESSAPDPFEAFTSLMQRLFGARPGEKPAVAAPSATGTSLEDFIDLCDRIAMPYRLTDAVLRIVMHHVHGDVESLADAREQLRIAAGRKAAA